MNENQRQLRRAAAEEFMRSLEQLGELLDDPDEAEKALPAQTEAEADLNCPDSTEASPAQTEAASSSAEASPDSWLDAEFSVD